MHLFYLLFSFPYVPCRGEVDLQRVKNAMVSVMYVCMYLYMLGFPVVL